MGDSLITIVAIGLAAVLMFVFPLMSLSERTDDISSLVVQSTTDEFVANIRTTGKITLDDYEKFLQTISSTGNRTGKMKLKEGDMVSVTVKNTNQTIAQLLRNFFYQITGNGSGQIVGKSNGVVTVNGSN